MKKLWFLLALTLMLLVTAIFYYGKSTVKIIEIDPNTTVPLKSGSEVHFVVKIKYNIVADSATINLIIQNSEFSGNINAVVGSTLEVVNKGKGFITLEKTVTVPDTRSLQIFTPIMIPGKAQTTTVDMKVYKVIR